MIRGRSTAVAGPPSAAGRFLVAHALLLGERINTAGLERDGVIATVPLSFPVGERGMATLFRYGAAVFVDVEPERQSAILAELADRISGPEAIPDEETAIVVVQPEQDEQITAGGAIQLREPTPEHLLIVADVLAKSVALARDERRVAGVFDAIEPFAATLAARGRPPGARRRISCG